MSIYDDLGYADPTVGSAPLPAAPSFSPDDINAVVKTVYGEAGNQNPLGQQAVASVILNRHKLSGQPLSDIVHAPFQFEPWMSRRSELDALDPSSPTYQKIYANIQPVLSGQAPDPTGGATHFYSPKAQAALALRDGRPLVPSWAQGLQGTDIGGNRFFKLGYGGSAPAQPTVPMTPADATMQTPNVPDQAPAVVDDTSPLARFMKLWQLAKGQSIGAPMQAMALAPDAAAAAGTPAPAAPAVAAAPDSIPGQQPMTAPDNATPVDTSFSPTAPINQPLPASMLPADDASDAFAALSKPQAPSAPQQAAIDASSKDVNFSPEMMRALMGGGYGSPLSSIFGALATGMGYGATHGLGAGFAAASEGINQSMDQYRREQMMMAPKAFAMQSLAKQYMSAGMSAPDAMNKAMVAVFAPEAAGKWELHDVQDGLGMPTTVLQNTATGQIMDQSGKVFSPQQFMAANGAGGGSGFGGTQDFRDENGKPLAGQPLLDAIKDKNANLGAVVGAVARYAAKPSDVASMRGGMRTSIYGLASRVNGDPNFSLANYEQRYKTRQAFAAGGAAFKDKQAMDQLMNHMTDYYQASEEWGKLQAPSGSLFSYPENAFITAREQMKQNPLLKRMEADADAAGDEIAKSWKGGGMASDAESAKWDRVLHDPNSTLQERRAVIKEIALRLIPGRIKPYQDQINAPGMEDLQLLTPGTARAMQFLQGQLAPDEETPASEVLNQSPVQAAAPGGGVGGPALSDNPLGLQL